MSSRMYGQGAEGELEDVQVLHRLQRVVLDLGHLRFGAVDPVGQTLQVALERRLVLLVEQHLAEVEARIDQIREGVLAVLVHHLHERSAARRDLVAGGGAGYVAERFRPEHDHDVRIDRPELVVQHPAAPFLVGGRGALREVLDRVGEPRGRRVEPHAVQRLQQKLGLLGRPGLSQLRLGRIRRVLDEQYPALGLGYGLEGAEAPLAFDVEGVAVELIGPDKCIAVLVQSRISIII